MNLSKNTIVSFWHNKNPENQYLPDLVVLSIKSWLDAGFTYELYSYQKFKNIPYKCILKDASSILPFSEFFVHKSGSIAMFADYFRIHLLLKFDNVVWTDTDNVFIKDNYDKDFILTIQDGRIQNSLICFGQSTIKDKVKECLSQFIENPLAFRAYDSPKLRKYKLEGIYQKTRFGHKCNYRSLLDWTMSGSELYTSIFRYLNIMHLAFDYYKFFNPFHYASQHKLYVDDISSINSSKFKDVGILILSNDLLRRNALILENYNNNSFMSHIFKMHDVGFLHASNFKQEKSIPKILHYCWFGGQKTDLAKRCIESWHKYCPDYMFMEWNEQTYDLKNACQFVKEAYSKKKYGFIVDVVRLEVVKKYGGIYLDCDVELLSSLDTILECNAFFAFEKDTHSNSHFKIALGLGFGSQKDFPMLDEYLDLYRHIPFDGIPSTLREQHILKQHGLIANGNSQLLDSRIAVLGHDVLCPMGWKDRILTISSNTIGIHHYSSSWK